MPMNKTNEVIRVEGLQKWYQQRNSKILSRDKIMVKAVDGVNFTIYEGEVFGIIGESGCGKSTLGRVLVRLEDSTEGEVYINNEASKDLMKNNPKAFRKSTQIIFQNPFDTFNPRHTIEKILTRALKIHNIGTSHEERIKICSSVLDEAGLKPAGDYLGRYPHELSGGQLQRISILRSMLLKPKFLVADEPVSMLDVSVRAEIINILLDLVKDQNTSMLFISHDIAITKNVSDRIAVMYLGRIVELGDSEEIVKNPLHPYTQALISNCPSINIEENLENPIDIDGEPPTPIDQGPGCYFADRCFKATGVCFREYPKALQMRDGHLVSCHNIALTQGEIKDATN